MLLLAFGLLNASAESLAGKVQGPTVDITPDLSAANLDLLEKAALANSDKEFGSVLRKMYRQDADGKYPPGVHVRTDLVTITGRVTDEQGRPVVGAQVRGEPDPLPNSNTEAERLTRRAVTDKEGRYELTGYVPPELHRVAGYLSGGDPTEFGSQSFYVEIHVEAPGLVQDKNAIPRVVPLNEELVGAARRYLQIIIHWAGQNKGKSEIAERSPKVPLPAIHANTVSGVDIVVKVPGAF